MNASARWTAVALSATVVACGSGKSASPTGCALARADGGNAYDPQIVASDFVTTIDNPYYPLTPGTVYLLRDGDGNTAEITVTSDTKTIVGVTTRVIHDVARTATGELLEDTFDWFAQDSAGNVWYFGEDTKAYQGTTVISTLGSWEAGVDCAQPGIIMEANPQVGDSYRQEYYAGVAEDRADVLALGETVTVPYGTFDNCIRTRDYSELSPGMEEHKQFCPGIGFVSAQDIVMVGTGAREDLVSVTGP